MRGLRYETNRTTFLNQDDRMSRLRVDFAHVIGDTLGDARCGPDFGKKFAPKLSVLFCAQNLRS